MKPAPGMAVKVYGLVILSMALPLTLLALAGGYSSGLGILSADLDRPLTTRGHAQFLILPSDSPGRSD